MTTPADITHLWRRAAFWISAEEAEARAGRPWAELVGELVDPTPAPMARPAELDDRSLAGAGEVWRAVAVARTWLDHMATTPTQGAEKLTWFWHGHFTTSVAEVVWGEGAFRQLHVLRGRAQGPFRALLGDLVVDGAMCFYLDNVKNLAGKLNENFARELLELFTVGVGNHTQADVMGVARSMTGHNVDWSGSLLPRFYPQHHDTGEKTVLGVTGNFDAAAVCDILCTGPRKHLVARRVASKLWSAWGYPDPAPALVDELAAAALADGATGRAFARAVLLHPEFRSERARCSLVRSPVEQVVSLSRATKLLPSVVDAASALNTAGQAPYLPPTVAGWASANQLASEAAWWSLGDLRYRTIVAMANRTNDLPATVGLAPDAAARAAFRWAGVVDASDGAVARLASYVTTVRSTEPTLERLWIALAVSLTPEFVTGGGH